MRAQRSPRGDPGSSPGGARSASAIPSGKSLQPRPFCCARPLLRRLRVRPRPFEPLLALLGIVRSDGNPDPLRRRF